MILSIVGVALLVVVITVAISAVFLRRVVETNEVHIVQSSKATTSYGKDTTHGNAYYEWPSWVPLIGVSRITLPMSVFDVTLKGYEAYDKGRVPFVVDVVAFFRINNSNLAAERVLSFEELHNQLVAIVQGAVRTIMATNQIEDIMEKRSEYGVQFTKEVQAQLMNWGVETVKNIELMDIKDHPNSQVIKNIMQKKESLIEMESRKEVAGNMKDAEIAETIARQETATQKQASDQIVGLRTAEQEREVGIAKQLSQQAIKEQEKVTKEKEMEVVRVAEETKAKINKNVQVTKAEQDKETAVIVAEGGKQTTILNADGQLEAKKRESEGINLEGEARANAEKAMQLAPVEAQIVLAKEIGGNQGYQQYLVTIRQVEANQAVGIKQAEALKEADIKIIANTGEPVAGVTKIMDLFTSKGGTQLAAMAEGLAQSNIGREVLNAVGVEAPNGGNRPI